MCSADDCVWKRKKLSRKKVDKKLIRFSHSECWLIPSGFVVVVIKNSGRAQQDRIDLHSQRVLSYFLSGVVMTLNILLTSLPDDDAEDGEKDKSKKSLHTARQIQKRRR